MEDTDTKWGVVTIFLLPPSYEELERRIRGRCTENDDTEDPDKPVSLGRLLSSLLGTDKFDCRRELDLSYRIEPNKKEYNRECSDRVKH